MPQMPIPKELWNDLTRQALAPMRPQEGILDLNFGLATWVDKSAASDDKTRCLIFKSEHAVAAGLMVRLGDFEPLLAGVAIDWLTFAYASLCVARGDARGVRRLPRKASCWF